MFGSSKHLAPEEPKLFGAQKERVATNESARVLPYFAGSRWLGVTWMGNAFRVKTTPIVRKVGKKKQTTGYNYYASLVGLVGCGVADIIRHIRFDDEMVWTGAIVRGTEDYVAITTTRGIVYFYWGTETQTIHPLVAEFAADQNHSAMRGQCYLFCDSIYFGPDRTNAPNIEVDVTRAIRPTFLSVGEALIGAGTDVNPVAVLWDWWTNKRFGLGRPDADLDTVRLRATALTLKAEDMGISPFLDGEEDMKSAIIKLLEYIDGYPTSYDGKLGVELCRSSSSPVQRLTTRDLISEPSLVSQMWPDTYDEIRVKFKNYLKEGNDDLVKHHELASFRITGRHRMQTLDRPWVITTPVAQRIAQSAGRRAGIPQVTGSLGIRESKAEQITVGSVFEWRTRDGELLRLRCNSRGEPAPGKRAVDIGFESDTGWSNTAHYAATPDDFPDVANYVPEPAFAVRIFDSPYAFSQNNISSLIYMVARGDELTTEYDVWRATADEGTYESAAEARQGTLFGNFAVQARLTTQYNADTPIVDESIGIVFEVLSPDQTLLDDEWDRESAFNHTLLGFFGPTAGEIMSLFNVAKTGATTYTAKTIRGLYDTRPRLFGVGTEIWIQLRSKLDVHSWPPFSMRRRYYKIQPRFVQAEVSLGDITPISHTDNGRSLLPLCPLNLAANGDSVAPTWLTGQDVTVTWQNTARARTILGLAMNEIPPTDLTSVAIQIRSADNFTLLTEVETAADESHVLTDAFLISTVNDSFMIRIIGIRDGFRSIDVSDLLVTKI